MIEKKVKELLEEPIKEKGFTLDEVSYIKKGKENTLIIVIDKEGYININDCLSVNKLINPMLDKADLIKESYILEVCSKEKGSD